MKKYLKQILIGLTFGLFSGVVTAVMTVYMFAPFPPNQALLVDEDLIVIRGNGPITLSIWATDSDGVTTLSIGNTTIVSTHPGAMPNYYEVVGTIEPGTYSVSGSTSNLILSENGTVENPAYSDNLSQVRWLLNKMMFLVGLVFGLFISPLYVNRTRL